MEIEWTTRSSADECGFRPIQGVIKNRDLVSENYNLLLMAKNIQ
jgi:hypothetical protein